MAILKLQFACIITVFKPLLTLGLAYFTNHAKFLVQLKRKETPYFPVWLDLKTHKSCICPLTGLSALDSLLYGNVNREVLAGGPYRTASSGMH